MPGLCSRGTFLHTNLIIITTTVKIKNPCSLHYHTDTTPLLITILYQLHFKFSVCLLSHTQILQALNLVLPALLFHTTSHTPVLCWSLPALSGITSSPLYTFPRIQDFTLYSFEPPQYPRFMVKPIQGNGFSSTIKICCIPSFGREVKPEASVS